MKRKYALTIAFVVIFSMASVFFVRRRIPVLAATIPDIIVDDMKLASEGTPHGVPGYSWENGSDGGDTASFPSGFGAIQGWGHLYEDVSGNPASNSRVQIRNFQTWWLSKSTNQWTRGQYENDIGGAAFQEDYNGAKDGNIQKIDGLPTITAGGGYNFHFWHTQDGWNVPNAGDYKAIVTAFEARLVLGNAGGTDDRASAKYLITSAIDTYVSQGNHGSDGKLPNLGIGRAKYVKAGWRLYTHNTVSNMDASIIRNNPPPLVIGADNIDVSGGGGTTPGVTNNPNCPKKNQGDADCNGTISLADYQLWKNQFTGLTALGSADFNTDSKITLVDYNIWRVTFLAGQIGTTISPPKATDTPGGGGGGACVGGAGATVKIMALGDSITGGTDGRGGYRFKLYSLLTAANKKFDFVGPLQDGSVADNDNAGYGGYQAGQPNDTSHGDHMVSKEVPTIIPQYSPNVVLLLIGVNDMFGGWANTPWGLAGSSKNVVDMVKQIRTLAPNAYIIVSPQTSWGPQDSGDPDRMTMNATIKSGVAGLTKVIYAETMASTITNQYTPQDVHPSAAGYDKMADVWWSYLNPILCP